MRILASIAIVLLCGCRSSPQSGASTSEVILTVEPDAVAAGDSVTLTLSNESSGDIGYNLCTSSLERQSNGDWQSVPSDRVCTMELRTLGPARQTEYAIELPEELAPGAYRYGTSVEMLEEGIRHVVRSDPFQVRR